MQNKESYDPTKDPIALASQEACREYSRLHPIGKVDCELFEKTGQLQIREVDGTITILGSIENWKDSHSRERAMENE